MKIRRFDANPIIVPHMDARMGDNINGPSLIRVPAWVGRPLGRYYLYFAHHKGTYIRLAYADSLEGPWRTHEPGVLELAESNCENHIASPDVHIDEQRREIRMYFHGGGRPQVSKLAISRDGLSFVVSPEGLGVAYFRVWRWRGRYYAIANAGHLYGSADGVSDFRQGPMLFTRNMRHSAVKLDGDVLSVFYSNAGDCPEHIVASRIKLAEDWARWEFSQAESVALPETDYEGADMPLEPSRRGAIWQRVRQLRDPGIFREDGRTYLLYSVAGERGIAIAELL